MTQQKKQSALAALFEWLEALMFALGLVMLVFVFVCKVYTVNGDSMYPTLNANSRILVWSLFYQPQDGDIVVLDNKTNYGDSLVKRVIATEGQTVDIDAETGALSVDGVQIDVSADNLRGDLTYPLTVPQGYCFVMGDNRGISFDSRYTAIGFIDERSVMGTVVFVLSPREYMGTVE